LKIEGDKTKRFVQVKVKDNGNGFPQKDAGKIFNTFTRLNNKPCYVFVLVFDPLHRASREIKNTHEPSHS
jgi:hypothetical protein